MNGRACRRKGREFERKVQKLLAEVFGERVVQRGAVLRDGQSAADVLAPGLWVECKAHRRTNPRAALRQALRAAFRQPRWPVAICKDDRKQPHVMMTLRHFLELLHAWHSLRNAG